MLPIIILILLVYIFFALFSYYSFFIILEDQKLAIQNSLTFLSILAVAYMTLLMAYYFKTKKKKIKKLPQKKPVKEKNIKDDIDYTEADNELLLFEDL